MFVLLQKHLMCLDAPFADMIPKDPYADYYFAVDQTWEQGYAADVRTDLRLDSSDLSALKRLAK